MYIVSLTPYRNRNIKICWQEAESRKWEALPCRLRCLKLRLLSEARAVFKIEGFDN